MTNVVVCDVAPFNEPEVPGIYCYICKRHCSGYCFPAVGWLCDNENTLRVSKEMLNNINAKYVPCEYFTDYR